MIDSKKITALTQFYGTIEAARDAWRAVARLAKNMGGLLKSLDTVKS